MPKRLALGEQHLAHPGDLAGLIGRRPRTLAQHQDVDVRGKGGGRRHSLVGGVAQVGAVVVGDDENDHQSTPASVFSLATSSAALSTLIPAWRLGGSATLSTFRCG